MTEKQVSNRLTELRKKRGYTLADVGKALGVGTNTISRYETGKREPKLETWQKLADFFGVSVQYLQGISDVPNANSSLAAQTSEALFQAVGNQKKDQPIDFELVDRLINMAASAKSVEELEKKVEPLLQSTNEQTRDQFIEQLTGLLVPDEMAEDFKREFSNSWKADMAVRFSKKINLDASGVTAALEGYYLIIQKALKGDKDAKKIFALINQLIHKYLTDSVQKDKEMMEKLDKAIDGENKSKKPK